MTNSNFFLKLPINFKNKCKVYAPSINEIVGNEYFNTYKKILTISQEELEDEFLKNDAKDIKVPTPIEFLLANSYNDKNFEQIAKNAFKFFIKEDVTFIYERKSNLMQIAAFFGSHKCVSALLEKGIPLQGAERYAAASGSLEVIEIFRKHDFPHFHEYSKY